jgi:phosphohistidine phosphatase SixA
VPPTELYLVRHAIVADRGDEWPDDTKRPLTKRGIGRFRECVTGLRELKATVDEIFTSPLVRAKQTADIPLNPLGYDIVRLRPGVRRRRPGDRILKKILGTSGRPRKRPQVLWFAITV